MKERPIRERGPMVRAMPWTNYLWHGRKGVTQGQVDSWPHQFSGYRSAYPSFSSLWDSTNAKRAPWESNPWVWVYDFTADTGGGA